MRRFVVLAVALFAITIANAAPPVRVLTQPKLPPRAAFDRLNLEVAWLATLPIEGHRDGIAAVQQIGNQLYIQLRDGNILACHPETGEVQWSRRVGTHYPIGRHLGIGNGVIFVIDGLTVHALEATTGVEKWTLDMPAVPSAPPAADNSMLYVPLSNGRVQSYRMPRDPNATLTKEEKAKANASPAYKIFNRTPLNQDDADKPLTKTAIDPRSTVIVGSGTRTASPTTIENRATTSVSVGTTRRGASRQLTDEEVRLVAARPTMVGSSSLHNFTLTNPPLINTVGVLFTGNVASTYTQRYDLEQCHHHRRAELSHRLARHRRPLP